MSDSELVDAFFTAKAQLLESVGLRPDWVECPIDDCRHMYWYIEDNSILYAGTLEALKELGDDYYSDDGMTVVYYQFWTKYWMKQQQNIEWKEIYKDEIYTQRFYPKWVYRGKEVTLIMCDPHVDGCKWWRIYDNAKEYRKL